VRGIEDRALALAGLSREEAFEIDTVNMMMLVEEETYFDLCECFFERVFVAAEKMVPGQKVEVNDKQCSERFRARYVPSSTATEPDDVVMNYRYCPVHACIYACMYACMHACM
jgi:hypothetical protein